MKRKKSCSCSAMKKKVVSHLKGDEKGYRHEIKEDETLRKELKKKPKRK